MSEGWKKEGREGEKEGERKNRGRWSLMKGGREAGWIDGWNGRTEGARGGGSSER